MKISPATVKNYLDYFIVNQEQAKRTLSIAGYTHFIKNHELISTHDLTIPRHVVLLSGPTGSGKSELAKALCKYTGLLSLTIDATTLAAPGWHGHSIYDCFERLFNINRSVVACNKAIIVIDEFDKLSSSGNDTNISPVLKNIQASLLKIIDGESFDVYNKDQKYVTTLDSSNMLFILCGAFENKHFIKDEAHNIGFCSNTKETKDTLKLNHNHLEKLGFMAELTGRVSLFAQTNKLTKADIKSILMNIENSVLAQYKSLANLGGHKLALTNAEINDIIDEAYNSSYGARHLKSILYNKIEDKLFNLETEFADPEPIEIDYSEAHYADDLDLI